MRPQAQPRQPKPEWLKVRAPGSPNYLRLKDLMRSLGLHTVCEEAHCPNIGECWHHGTATFMILGDVCTRSCGYCSVAHGRPGAVDRDEPGRVARAVDALQLSYVVITSVDRDDLEDGGASLFAETIRQTRRRRPECRLEVLIPDFQGHEAALQTVLDARPAVLNHNIETVRRMYREARPGGRYSRALELLERSRRYAPAIPTKSGLMVGLGEEWPEIVSTLADLQAVGCGIRNDRSVPPPFGGASTTGTLLHAGRIHRAQEDRPTNGLRPCRIRPPGAQLLSRPRTDERIR